MLWLNFLHFYQPANSEFYNIRKALDKSYFRLLRLLEEHPDLHFTANVSGCLIERLEEAKEHSFIERLQFLVKKGRLELTGSAAFHGFLPLLPESEVIRQVKANEKILRRVFGRNFKPAGFFLPEMAYTPELGKLIKRLGYSWIIIDEISYEGGAHQPDPRQLYIDAASGLKVIFRSRSFSTAYPPDKLLPIFKEGSSAHPLKEGEADKVFITATDAELYGLRHEDPTGVMEQFVKLKNLNTVTVSSFIKGVTKKPAAKVNLLSSSWESTLAEVKKGQPFSLWLDKKNKIQVYLWKLAELSLSLEKKYQKDKNFYWHRWHLVRGLASCTFWWASARDFSKIFGPYAWSPDDIERGLEDLIRSVRSIFDPRAKKDKLLAEKYYLKIKKLIWEAHWQKYWRKII